MEMLLQFGLLVVGFVMLIKGADWFVEGASKVADRFGIPQIVIGLTIVAMGTSLPEAAVSISAALKSTAEGASDVVDITIGNVVGSNIMNVLLILGLTSVIRSIAVKKNTIRYEMPFTIGITIILAVMGLLDNRVGRIEGVILWIFMILYLLYLVWVSKTDKDAIEEAEAADEKDSIVKMIFMIFVGAGMIVLGSDVTVDAATAIATGFGMSKRLVGLTIVAFGTSLPELVTSCTAAVKGKADIAVGNIVGSNIFNILFVVGTTALITPVPYSTNFMVDSIVAVAAMVLLLICVIPKKRLGRVGGIVMLLGYAGYFIYLIR